MPDCRKISATRSPLSRALLTVLVWAKMYPEPYDPKNIHNVLWKHGLNHNMDLDAAVAGMTHYVSAVRLVKGMTKAQLNSRFGYVRSLDEASPYLKSCCSLPDTTGELGVSPHGKEVVFLRKDQWMVILEDGKAVDLVLCKGY